MAKNSTVNLILNVFWVIFGGLVSAIGAIFAGIINVVFIIPLIFGVPQVYFRFVTLVFAPFGKKVYIDFNKGFVRNIIYMVFGGFFTMIGNYVYGALLCATIIGIPLGLQQFKMAKYFVAPFGAEVK